MTNITLKTLFIIKVRITIKRILIIKMSRVEWLLQVKTLSYGIVISKILI